MHCPHALMVLPLLVRVPRSGGRSLLYRGYYHRHLTGTPSSCIFLYTPLYLLQFFFELLEAHPWRPFCHNMHLQAINITDHWRKRIFEKINHYPFPFPLPKEHVLMRRLVSLKILKNLQYHRRRYLHKISSKSAILMLFIWH